MKLSVEATVVNHMEVTATLDEEEAAEYEAAKEAGAEALAEWLRLFADGVVWDEFPDGDRHIETIDWVVHDE